jgi:hypothetical protein
MKSGLGIGYGIFMTIGPDHVTLKELWTSVSSKSNTKVFFPMISGVGGGSKKGSPPTGTYKIVVSYAQIIVL